MPAESYLIEYDRDKFTGESVVAILNFEKHGASVYKKCLCTHFDKDAEWLYKELTGGKEFKHNKYDGLDFMAVWDDEVPAFYCFVAMIERKKGQKRVCHKELSLELKGEAASEFYKKLMKETNIYAENESRKGFQWPKWSRRIIFED